MTNKLTLPEVAISREFDPYHCADFFSTLLADALYDRYLRTRRLEDLDEIVQIFRQLVASTSPSWMHRSEDLNVLANRLHDRYFHTGRLEDLEEAIRLYQQAVDTVPLDSPHRPMFLTALGAGLRNRYHRTRRLEDLEEAIRSYQQAVDSVPLDSPNRPTFLNNLGNGLHDRYTHVGRPEDLEKAIWAWQQAIACPSSSQNPLYFVNLGNGLLLRYSSSGQLKDLKKAIQLYQQAVEFASPDCLEWPMFLSNLGRGLSYRYTRTKQPKDLKEAIRVYRQACEEGLARFPQVALKAGQEWGYWALGRQVWAEAVEAYNYAMQALRQLLTSQYRWMEKTSWLKEAQTIASRLAYAYYQREEHEKAVGALESGRAQMLREALERNRSDLERLTALGFGDLYERFIRARDEETRLQAISVEHRPPDWSKHLEAARRDLQEAAEAIRQQVGEQHQQYRFFLQSMPFEEILRQATEAPLVYLVATEHGGFALIVHAGGKPQAVDLPDLTEKTLNSWLVWTDETKENVGGGYLSAQLAVPDRMSAALARLLPELGEKAMGPVAEALRTLPHLPSPAAIPPSPLLTGEGKGAGSRGEVTLIPAGRLALLPLHAARYRVDGREVCFLDEFSVTYAPSAQALAEARRRLAALPDGPFHLAGVGNPLPPVEALRDLHRQLQEAVAVLPDGPAIAATCAALARLVELSTEELRHRGFELQRLVRHLPERLGKPLQRLLALARQWPLSLPYGKAELQSVADLLPAAQAEPLYEEEATHDALLERLPRATVAHFSCHGSFDPADPLRSALHLADRDLTLGEMLEADFAGLQAVRLAVLSACQTAITDFRDLPEEAIGLPAGLLQAGAPAVVGTLWPVADASTALLMTRFYEYLWLEGQSWAQALRRAQFWLRDLTNAELEAYLKGHPAITEALRRDEQQWWLHQLAVRDAPEKQRYGDPYYWAPFIAVGASEMPLSVNP